MTKKQKLEYQRKRRLRNNNADTHKYEKTPNGFLMRLYRNMKSRITGIQKKKYHLYMGKELLPKDEFYIWAKNSPDFWRLYKHWTANNYDQKLTPSVNRIRSEFGYKVENMEWVTNSINSALSSVTKRNKDVDKKLIYNLLGVGFEENKKNKS